MGLIQVYFLEWENRCCVYRHLCSDMYYAILSFRTNTIMRISLEVHYLCINLSIPVRHGVMKSSLEAMVQSQREWDS